MVFPQQQWLYKRATILHCTAPSILLMIHKIWTTLDSNATIFTVIIHWYTQSLNANGITATSHHKLPPVWPSQASYLIESSWNVTARGNVREGKWRGNWWMKCVASTLYTTSEHGVSSFTTANVHNSAASRLNLRPGRFKWIRPFRRKTKYGFCACAITFQTQSTTNNMNSSWYNYDTQLNIQLLKSLTIYAPYLFVSRYKNTNWNFSYGISNASPTTKIPATRINISDIPVSLKTTQTILFWYKDGDWQRRSQSTRHHIC
jgi:hypothetical protein